MNTVSQDSVKNELKALPEFCKLSERVWRVMGLNPGPFTLQGTNTYLVGAESAKVLIDCNDGKPGYVELLMGSLASMDAYITDIYISHCHSDHTGGVKDVMSSALAKSRNIRVHKFADPSETSSPEYIGGLPEEICVTELKDNQLIEIDSSTHLRVVHTPGHLKDHCSFYLEEENHVFTGDCVLGHGAAAFEDLQEYLMSLQRILKLRPNWLFPGHGDTIRYGTQTLEKYLEVRQRKDEQILQAMETQQVWTARLLTAFMNPETSRHRPEFRQFSIRIVGLHLIKLHNEGRLYMLSKDAYEKRTGLRAYNPLTVLSAFDEEWTLYSHCRL